MALVVQLLAHSAFCIEAFDTEFIDFTLAFSLAFMHSLYIFLTFMLHATMATEAKDDDVGSLLCVYLGSVPWHLTWWYRKAESHDDTRATRRTNTIAERGGGGVVRVTMISTIVFAISVSLCFSLSLSLSIVSVSLLLLSPWTEGARATATTSTTTRWRTTVGTRTRTRMTRATTSTAGCSSRWRHRSIACRRRRNPVLEEEEQMPHHALLSGGEPEGETIYENDCSCDCEHA